MALEDLRCQALGNSFHTGAVAVLLDHALWSLGVKALKGHHAIMEEWRVELTRLRENNVFPPCFGSDTDDEDAMSQGSDITSAANLPLENRFKEDVMSRRNSEDQMAYDCRLSVQMVNAFVKRQEYPGSDVRLDVGTLYRPDSFPRGTVSPHRWRWHVAHSYRFTQQEHINLLELRALIHTFEWRARRATYGDVRSLHLCDSQVVLSVCVKGRSSSRQLNRLLRKWAALQVSVGIFPLLAWIETHLNPADEPSRRYE